MSKNYGKITAEFRFVTDPLFIGILLKPLTYGINLMEV